MSPDIPMRGSDEYLEGLARNAHVRAAMAEARRLANLEAARALRGLAATHEGLAERDAKTADSFASRHARITSELKRRRGERATVACECGAVGWCEQCEGSGVRNDSGPG